MMKKFATVNEPKIYEHIYVVQCLKTIEHTQEPGIIFARIGSWISKERWMGYQLAQGQGVRQGYEWSHSDVQYAFFELFWEHIYEMYRVSGLVIPTTSILAINKPPKYGSRLNLPETAFANNRHEIKLIDCQWLAIVRLIQNSNLNFSSPTHEIVPLIMVSHPIKVGDEFKTAKENIVAKIISQPISSAFWFFGTYIALKGYFRVARNIAMGTWMSW